MNPEELLRAMEMLETSGTSLGRINALILQANVPGVHGLESLRSVVKSRTQNQRLDFDRNIDRRRRSGHRDQFEGAARGLLDATMETTRDGIISGNSDAARATAVGMLRGPLEVARPVAGLLDMAGAKGAAERLGEETFNRPLTQIEARHPGAAMTGRVLGTGATLFGGYGAAANMGGPVAGPALLSGGIGATVPEFSFLGPDASPLQRGLFEGGIDAMLGAALIPIAAARKIGTLAKLDLTSITPTARAEVLRLVEQGHTMLPGWFDEARGVFVPTGRSHWLANIEEPGVRNRLGNIHVESALDEFSHAGGGAYNLAAGTAHTRAQAAKVVGVKRGESSIIAEADQGVARTSDEARALLQGNAVNPEVVDDAVRAADDKIHKFSSEQGAPVDPNLTGDELAFLRQRADAEGLPGGASAVDDMGNYIDPRTAPEPMPDLPPVRPGEKPLEAAYRLESGEILRGDPMHMNVEMKALEDGKITRDMPLEDMTAGFIVDDGTPEGVFLNRENTGRRFGADESEQLGMVTPAQADAAMADVAARREALRDQRPAPDAPLSEWAEFYSKGPYPVDAEELRRAAAERPPIDGPHRERLDRINADRARRGEGPISDAQEQAFLAATDLRRGAGAEARARPIDPAPATRGVFEGHSNYGGSTIDPRTGETLAGEDLWAVAAEDLIPPRIQEEPFTEADIRAFIDDPEVQAALRADPDLRIGTASGADTSTGSGHEINLTKTFDDQDAAIQYGIENNQYSILNLAHPEFKSAPVPTPRAAQGAGPGRPPVTAGEAMTEQALYRAELNKVVPERAVAHREQFLEDLTPPERRMFLRMEQDNPHRAEEALHIASLMPGEREMASQALLGAELDAWYRSSADTILRTFGEDDAVRFAWMAAAGSPRTSIEGNAKGAIQIWRDWVQAGRPTGPEAIRKIVDAAGTELLPSATTNNAITALTTPVDDLISRRLLAAGQFAPQPTASGGRRAAAMSNTQGVLSGVKVDPFGANLLDATILGSMEGRVRTRPVIDTHEFAGAGGGPVTPGVRARRVDNIAVLGMTPSYRRTAARLSEMTGQPVDVSNVQAMRWGVIKHLREQPLARGQTLEARAAELLGSSTTAHGGGTPTFNQLRQEIGEAPSFATLLNEPENAAMLREVNIEVAPLVPADPERLANYDPSQIREADIFGLTARLDRVAQRRALFGLGAVAAGLGATESGSEEGMLVAGGAAALPGGRGWGRVVDDALRMAGVGPDVKRALESSRLGLQGSVRFLHENPSMTPEMFDRFTQFTQIGPTHARALGERLGVLDRLPEGAMAPADDLRSVFRVEDPGSGRGPFQGPRAGADQAALTAPTLMVPGPSMDFPERFSGRHADPYGGGMIFGFPDAATHRGLRERPNNYLGPERFEAAMRDSPYGLFQLEVPRSEVMTGKSGAQVMFPRPEVRSQRRLTLDDARDLGFFQLGPLAAPTAAAGLLSQRFRDRRPQG